MTFSNGQGLRTGRPAMLAARAPARTRGRSARLGQVAFKVALVAVVIGLYGPALRYGLSWDDPRWYEGLHARQTLADIFARPSPPTDQFYRPMAIIFGRAVITPTGVVSAPLAHAIQITAHLVVSLLVIPVVQGFGFRRAHAHLTALFVALFPWAYFTVAWQQNQQPLMMVWVMLALLAAQRYCRNDQSIFLAGSAAAYAVALLFQEGAVPFAALFVWLAWLHRRDQPGRWWWPALHLALAGAYVAIRFSLPIQSAVTGRGFQLIVLAFLSQSLVFPLMQPVARSLGGWPAAGLLAAIMAAWSLLGLGLWRRGARNATVVSCLWAACGLVMPWAGLSWEYAQTGARLVYPAAVGIAGIWAGWAALALTGQGWRRLAGALILVSVLAVSALQLWRFQTLFQVGTQQVARAVEVLSAAPHSRLLFVNFPDRLAVRTQPYPLGYWGLTLAPIIQDLSGFAKAATGHSADERSLSVFQTGAEGRAAWPFGVDMRGEDTPPEGVWAAAQWAEQVYLTGYEPGGRLSLQPVGAVQAVPEAPAPLATLEGGAALLGAEVLEAPGQPARLQMTWHSREPQALDVTIFVHIWREGDFVAAVDGDSLGGLLPPFAWRPDGAVQDLRPLPDLPSGQYTVTAGLYHRWDGARVAAFAPDGTRLAEDEILVAMLSVP